MRLLSLVDHGHECTYSCGSMLVKHDGAWGYTCATVHANRLHAAIVAGAERCEREHGHAVRS